MLYAPALLFDPPARDHQLTAPCLETTQGWSTLSARIHKRKHTHLSHTLMAMPPLLPTMPMKPVATFSTCTQVKGPIDIQRVKRGGIEVNIEL